MASTVIVIGSLVLLAIWLTWSVGISVKWSFPGALPSVA